MTRPRVGAALVGVSLALLATAGWNWIQAVRTPTASIARASILHPDPGSDLAPAPLSELRREVETARGRLVSSRAEVLALLDQVETLARHRGWRVDLTLGEPLSAPGGWTDLVGYPAALRLEPGSAKDAPGFESFLAWMEEVGRLPKQARIARFQVQRGTTGPEVLRVDLVVLGCLTHDHAASQ